MNFTTLCVESFIPSFAFTRICLNVSRVVVSKGMMFMGSRGRVKGDVFLDQFRDFEKCL